MFTGIIEQLGTVKAIRHQENLIVLDVDTAKLAKGIKPGASVAINGVCLTAAAKKGNMVSFDLMKETIEKTSLKNITAGDEVNLELALKADSRFGGHFVTGHVDELGMVKSIERRPNWVAMTITISKISRTYLVPKGSVAIDGISLTVGKVGKTEFSVYLIPYTLTVTNLGAKSPGDVVNIETDILAKYASILDSEHIRKSYSTALRKFGINSF
ncbi:MAG: riboflavin synthase [Candidatus Omnitrophica bacterium]|nr:riboflavin synthase [Candidatus Omnitrophota bacterium]